MSADNFNFHLEYIRGWESLYQPLIDRCKAAGVSIHDIKEKFGGLRVYVGCAPDDIYVEIDRAQDASFHMCQVCGAPGHTRDGAWVSTLCDAHHADRSWSRAAMLSRLP